MGSYVNGRKWDEFFRLDFESNSSAGVYLGDNAKVVLGTDTDISNYFDTTNLTWEASDTTELMNLSTAGVLTIPAMSSAGFVKNDANGTLSGGNSITDTDVPDLDTLSTSLTEGSVVFVDASSNLSEDNSNFFWDSSNSRLGLGNQAPTNTLHVTGTGFITGDFGIGKAPTEMPLEVIGSDITIGTSGSYNAIIGTQDGSNNNEGVLIGYDQGDDVGVISAVSRNVAWRDLIIATGGTERVRIDTSGNVGIGVTGPNELLHVGVSGGSDAGTMGIGIGGNTANARKMLIQKDTSTPYNADIYWGYHATSEAGTLGFHSSQDSGTLVEFVKDGGININQLTGTSNQPLQVNADSASGYASAVIDQAGGSGHGLLVKNAPTTAGTHYIADFRADNDSKFYIRDDGKVGVGTNSPGAAFHIKGDVDAGTAFGMRIENAGTGVNRIRYDSGGSSRAHIGVEDYNGGALLTGTAGYELVVRSEDELWFGAGGNNTIVIMTTTEVTFNKDIVMSNSTVNIVDGSYADPAVQFNDSSGIYQPANSTVAISSDGAANVIYFNNDATHVTMPISTSVATMYIGVMKGNTPLSGAGDAGHHLYLRAGTGGDGATTNGGAGGDLTLDSGAGGANGGGSDGADGELIFAIAGTEKYRVTNDNFIQGIVPSDASTADYGGVAGIQLRAVDTDGTSDTEFADILTISNYDKEYYRITSEGSLQTWANDGSGYVSGKGGSIRAVFRKDSISDNTATDIFNITTTNETGSNDGGAIVLFCKALIGHGVGSTTGNLATKGINFIVHLGIDGASNGYVGSVEEVHETASAGDNTSTRDIGTVTFSVVTNSAVNHDIQATIDLTGSNPATAKVVVLVEAVYEGFLTPPRLLQL